MPKVAPQVPGEVTEQPAAVEAVEATPAATVEVSQAELEALRAKAAALDAMAAKKKAASDNGLPDQSTIDPSKIKSPVLSKQGWVVPDEFGSNPAAKRL